MTLARQLWVRWNLSSDNLPPVQLNSLLVTTQEGTKGTSLKKLPEIRWYSRILHGHSQMFPNLAGGGEESHSDQGSNEHTVHKYRHVHTQIHTSHRGTHTGRTLNQCLNASLPNTDWQPMSVCQSSWSLTTNNPQIPAAYGGIYFLPTRLRVGSDFVLAGLRLSCVQLQLKDQRGWAERAPQYLMQLIF